MRQLTHGALCNGIGGFALAAQWAGIRTIWTSDTDPFCNAVSRKHFPHAHQYGNIYDVYHPQRPDIISAGYPCQPVSYAGQRLGADDDRWLWPQVLRLIAECRPGWFIGENVAGHVTMGLASVLADLEAAGYEVWPVVLPACALGAPHRRDRAWIIAHAHHRLPERPQQALRAGRDPACAGCEVAAHADCQRCSKPDVQPVADGESEGPRTNSGAYPEMAAYTYGGKGGTNGGHDGAGGWSITQPALCARDDEIPARLVRPDRTGDEPGSEAAPGGRQADPKHWARNTLKAAGNALVPQIPELFFQFIADYERR